MKQDILKLSIVVLLLAVCAFPCAADEVEVEELTYVVVDVANVRSGPGTGHSIVFKVQWGDELVVLSPGTNWMRVRNPKSGEVGWIFKELISPTKPSDEGSGTYSRHKYTYARARGSYLVRFRPVLPRDDTIVVGAMLELVNVVYGKHLLVSLVPKLVERNGENLIRFKGKKRYYYFLLIKEDTGKVSSFSMWREGR